VYYHCSKLRFLDTLTTIYLFMLCNHRSWYLELAKAEDKIDNDTYDAPFHFFEQSLQLLHPFMPFVTEEIWQRLREREKNASIMVADWPEPSQQRDQHLLDQVEKVKSVISNVRNIRKKSQISPKEALELKVNSSEPETYDQYSPLITKLANIKNIEPTEGKLQQAKSFRVGNDEFFVPLDIDIEQERKKLEEELEYIQGFLEKVEKKLSNEGFLNNAPTEVVEKEKKKKEK
jgi:valyl-tRNA synthetase